MAFPISPIDGQQATVNNTVYTYNSTDGAWYRTGTTIGGGGSGTFVTQNYTGTGSQTAFSVTSGVTVSSVIVTENGVVQTPTTDYTISGTTLTFTTAPASGTAIQIREIAIAAAAGVKITALTYANSAVSANTLGSETIAVTGSGFNSNAKVYIDTTLCTTTYVSSTSLTFVSPAKSLGSYMLYVYNTDGSSGVYPVGITYVPRTPTTVEYLVVAGGGAGGGWAGGGGGAGGYRTATGYSITSGVNITVTVGAGGAATPSGTYTSGNWSPGENSIFGSVTATGGGAGATFGLTPAGGAGGVNGGSGGGASYGTSPGTGTVGQGNDGSSYTASYAGGGGGGSGAAGSNKDGGAGLQSSITGTPTYYAGGGAASAGTGGLAAGTGGLGGGANGISSGGPATSGTANTGGGGASAYTTTSTGTSQTGSGAGGSGVVIIRYSDIYSAANTTGSPTVTVAGGYRIYKWTTSGSITF